MSKSHLKLLETNEAARDGRSSGFLEAPEAPGDGTDEQIWVVHGLLPNAILELENHSLNALG